MHAKEIFWSDLNTDHRAVERFLSLVRQVAWCGAPLASFPGSTPPAFYRKVYKSDKKLGGGAWEQG